MEKKVASKKGLKKSVATAIDPFAEVAESPKTVLKAPSARSKTVKKRPAAKSVTEAAPIEAFSEIAKMPVGATSTTTGKKSPTRGKAKVKTAKNVKAASRSAKAAVLDTTAAAPVAEVEVSPVFKALAEVTLPELRREDRARLLMQSPTRLYFYWSIRNDPWHTLRNVFGDDTGGYQLVLKLKDLDAGTETISPCDAEGNWWFSVEPNREYACEVGFYAVNRPYFRIIYSNPIRTPRRSPSERPATDAQWKVTADKFAEVLDVAGFSRDAIDVQMAGDDNVNAENAAYAAFRRFVGQTEFDPAGIAADDIRFVLLAVASGFTLEEIRHRVSASLYALLQANADKLAAGNAQSVLSEHFDINEAEWTEEEFSSAVYGASLVNFPRTLKAKKLTSKSATLYKPVGSHSYR